MDQPTNLLSGVGSRDTCVSKNYNTSPLRVFSGKLCENLKVLPTFQLKGVGARDVTLKNDIVIYEERHIRDFHPFVQFCLTAMLHQSSIMDHHYWKYPL